MKKRIDSSRREEERGEIMNETWSLLPDVILNTVFTYLPRTDQVSASQVCRNWSRAMDNPNLWRKIDIALEDATLESLQRILRFTKRYGQHLRYLTIQYDPNSLEENPELERPLITLIDDIHGRAQLRYFSWEFFRLDWSSPKSCLRHKFRNSICRFLKRQHSLSEVVMGFHYATIDEGNHILQAIAEGSGSTLQTLKLVHFFDPENAVFSNATYLSILDNFKHLEVVTFDYCCVSEAVILCLAHNCAGRLRSLVISCNQADEDVNYQTIGNDIWTQFKRECPNVRVDFELLDIRGLQTPKRLVPCQIPMRSLSYITQELLEEEEAMDATNFITYVLTNFEKTLEDLELEFDGTVPNVDTVLEEYLPSSKNLKRLVVTDDISDTFVEKVNAMREQKLIHLREFQFRPKKYDRIYDKKLIW